LIYALSLSIPASRDFGYGSFRAEILGLAPLSGEELIFGDQALTDPTAPVRFLIKNDRETKRQYWEYVKQRGCSGLIRRAFNIIDPKLAMEFYHTLETTVTVLTVYADNANTAEFSKVVRQLKSLARRYELSLFDPQIAACVEISDDSAELKYCD
jgi:hypothetical protein